MACVLIDIGVVRLGYDETDGRRRRPRAARRGDVAFVGGMFARRPMSARAVLFLILRCDERERGIQTMEIFVF